jgi:hypothetical protein
MTMYVHAIGRQWHILMPYIYTIHTVEVEVTKNHSKRSRKNKESIGKLNNDSNHTNQSIIELNTRK